MGVDRRGASAVSLLITQDLIIAVQVRAMGRSAEIVARGSIETPTGVIDGAFVQEPGRLAQAIRTLWRSMNLRERSVTIALPAPNYSLRPLRLPEAPPRERRQLVRGELEQMAALPIGGGGFDFLWMPTSTVHSGPNEVISYYTSDVVVDSMRDTLQRAGLQMECIEPASLALMRTHLLGQPAQRKLALLYAAEKHSDLCFHDGSQLRHIRRIPAGWADITPAGPHRNDHRPLIDVEEEPPAPLTETMPAWSIGEEPIRNAMSHDIAATDAVDQKAFLIAEVVRSLAFFAREYGETVRPESLLIVGASEVTNIIKQILAPVNSIEISSADPLSTFDLPRPMCSARVDADPAAYAMAAGAALGRLNWDNGIPVVDVSQQEEAARTRRRAPVALLAGMAGSTLWMIGSATAAIVLTMLESNVMAENGRLTTAIEKTHKEQAPALWYQQTREAAMASQAMAQIPAGSVLGRVAASTVPGMALTQLNVAHDGTITINGNAINIADVQRFATTLGEGKSVRNPVVQAMHQDPKGGLSFQVIGKFPRIEAPAEKGGKTDVANKE